AYQKDADGALIETSRRDDILAAVADAAQGAQVAADLPDQAGAVRDLVASYKRARASEAHTERGRPRPRVAPLPGVAMLGGRAAASLDPELRFRALYNLGLVGLREADADSAHREAHLGDAERAYREALLLRPHNPAAKWNLELAVRRRRGGSGGGSSNSPSGG